MIRNVVSVLGLMAFSLLSGCQGGGNTTLTTVPTAHLAISLSATSITVGAPLTFTVTALDASNLVVPTYVGTVHITASDTTAILPANATLVRGVGSFTVTFHTPGNQTITASDTVGDAASGTSPSVAVNPIPIPAITSLSPAQAVSGSAFTLTVNGANFVTGSVVRWNGFDLPTQFVNSGQVTAQISAGDDAAPGTATVTVFNPAPGGGSSNAATFNLSSPCPASGPAGTPASITVDPTGRFAYVAVTDCIANGEVLTYAINGTTGALTSIGQPVQTQDAEAVSVAVDPTGRFIYVANQGVDTSVGSVSSFGINATTGVPALTGVINATCAPPPSPASCTPWSVAVDPSGKFVYVANEGGNAPTSVSVYSVDATTGALTNIGLVALPSGGRANTVTVDPKGNFIYVTASNGIDAYAVDANTGALTLVGSTAAAAAAVAVDPAGKFTYGVNSSSNSVSMYTINGTTGALTTVGTIAAGTSPSSMAIDPSGKFAYVTNGGSSNVWVYTINGTTGALATVATVASGTTPSSIAISPSGTFAYVTNSGSSSISIYSIDPVTGVLTPVGTTGT